MNEEEAEADYNKRSLFCSILNLCFGCHLYTKHHTFWKTPIWVSWNSPFL